MRAGAVAMAALGVFGVVAASAPARADEYDNWRRHEWHEHEWREQRWREHEWRERTRHVYGPPPAYVQPGYAPQYYAQPGYAPPAAYYAPPPAYYGALSPRDYAAPSFPGVSIGFGFR